MFCGQTFEFWQPSKQTVVPKVKLFTCFWSAHSAHLFYLPNFFFNNAMNILLIENKSSWQTATYFPHDYSYKATPNFNSLVAKHVLFSPQIIRTHFFVTCTRLDATDSIWTWATLVRGECCHHCSLLKGWQVGFFIPFKTTTET